MKTRDKIIQTSLELFNEHGERAITTNHIAAHLGMSPGNLYYHFRNKQDIIQSIFQLYENNLKNSFQPYEQHEVNVELLIGYFDAMFNMLWQFRFLYANLTDILSQDEALKNRYLMAQQRLLEQATKILQQLSTDGLLQIKDDELLPLADTMKMLISSWIGYKLAQSKTTSVTKACLYEGVIRIIMITKAYSTQSSLDTFARLGEHYQQLSETTE
ncbi:MAG: TetR/AcrR family transcriptional regulator [Shewanella sp.]|nr:TetR/AcrR family transcriptional regulator [Shewanella sp.]